MTLPFFIPTVVTDRLTLRPPRGSDLDAMITFGASPRSHYVGGPFNRLGAWRFLMITIGQWALRGHGYWSVDRTADAVFIGRVGVIFPIDSPEPELAWSLFDGFEGYGYGSEAVVAARQYADTHFGLGPLASFIDPSNTRSLALATRVGARFERAFEEDGEPHHLYRHPKLGADA